MAIKHSNTLCYHNKKECVDRMMASHVAIDVCHSTAYFYGQELLKSRTFMMFQVDLLLQGCSFLVLVQAYVFGIG